MKCPKCGRPTVENGLCAACGERIVTPACCNEPKVVTGLCDHFVPIGPIED